jgi:type II secretory pathway component GspD/PulD (secretin)
MKKRSPLSANGVAPLIVAAVAASPMAANPALAQQSPAGQDPAAPTPPTAPAPQDAAARQSVRVRFNFKGQTYDQILDYFSRVTGLPIVRECEVPKGTVDYIYPKDYTLDEALRTLNVLLQTQNVMLRDEGTRLFLQKLDDMKRENVPTFVGQVPASVGDEEIVTVVLPLLNAQAKPVAEQLKGLVATYGSVTALEQQNSVLIVETAAQIRRLQRIIDELDRQDVENVIELLPVRFTKASTLITSLQALMGERVVEYVIQDGKRQKIEENRVAGLMLAADDRTNAIIARGPRAKIESVKQTIELLDVPIADSAAPTASGGRGMKTFSVEKVKADAAKQRLEQLFAGYPADKKPTIVALPEAERVTVVGDLGSIDDAERFIGEMEGFDPARIAAQKRAGATTRERLRGDRAIAAIELQSASPEAILAAARSLLSKRQQDEVTLVAGPDGRTILVGGDSADIAGIRAIVETLDRPANVDRQVRLMRVAGKDAEASLERARQLYEQQTPAGDAARSLRIEFDARSRELVLIGSAQSIQRFTELMNQVDSTRVVERETRQIAVANAQPSAIVAQARELAKQVLDPRDGSPFTPPAIEAVDAMKALLVSGTPEQVAQVQSLVAGLDRVGRDAFGFRAIPAPGADAARLVERTRSIYAQLAKGSEQDLPEPTVELDSSSGALLVSGRTASIATFEQALAQARLLMPPPRASKIVPMRAAKASEVAAKLQPLLASASPVDPSRSVPAAEIKVIEPTNSLYLVGEAPQLAMIESFVRDLDIPSPEELPPLRLLQLRGGDAAQVAGMLAKRYDERAPEERRSKPVRIEADSTTNTLIVTAHSSVFDEIKGFIGELNRAGDTGAGPSRETFVMALKAARATDLATALDKLYPPPPVPLDARGRPLPHLQKPKEVFVTADATTNSLIVEAPAERRASFEQLVVTLDRTPLPPQAELRTYRVEKGDIERIAQTLRDLGARGMLSKPGVDGAMPVEVVIQTEGQSRTLIVAGDAMTFEKTEQLLVQLQAVPTKRGVRVIDVGAADAAGLLAKALRLASLEVREGEPPAIETEIDAANGTIVASGDEEPLARFADACRQLATATAPSADVRVIPMTHAKAVDAKAYLDGLAASRLGQSAGFAKEPVIEVLDRTNSLLVAADARQHELLAVLLRNLDVPVGSTPPLRILQLRTADAATLANALMQSYAQRSPEEKGAKPVQITAEAQTNALIVAAHPDLLPEIQQMVEDLNGATRQSASDREIRIFSLRIARAAELARTIDEMYPPPPVPVDPRGRVRPELQPPREVVVRADAQTNSLIVDAPISRMAGFEKLVEQLDRAQSVPESEIRTWRLAEGNLEGVAKTIRELATAGKFGPEGASTVVSTDSVSKTLVVSATATVFPRVEQVVRGFEGAPAPATTLRVFKLKGAKPEALAPLVRSALEGRLAEIDPALAGRATRVLDIAPERRSNALIVSAPDVLMPVVEELVRQLDDGNLSAGEPVVRVRPLLYADATEVATSLGQALAAATNPVTREPLAIKVIPATGSNALLMVGPTADLDEADKLIAPLDERPALDSVDAKTFALKNADATRIAPLVQKLLADQQDTDPRLALERARRSRGQLAPTPPVRVESDTRTNSLIVSGAARIMSVAEGLIRELDRDSDAAARAWAVFTPTKAPAAALVDEARRILENAGGGGASRVELSALPQSGTIVIVGGSEGTERAKEILAELDGKAFTAPQADFKVIQLRHVAPDVVVSALTAVLSDRSRWPASLVSAAKAGAAVAEPRVVADPLNARVIVTAPSELMPVATEVVNQLDKPREGDAPVEIRVYPLSEAAADTVAKAIEQAVATRAVTRPGRVKPTITPELTSNSIVVAADPAQLDEIEKTVRDMDVRGPRDAARVRTVFLKQARAGQMAPLVEQLLAKEAAQAGEGARARARGAAASGAEPALRVIADERLNAVVISATPTALDAAEEMLRQLDVAPGTESDRTVRVITMRNGDASEVAKSLADIFETDDGTETPPVIRVNVASNSLLVRANSKQYAMIESIVSRLDGAALASSRSLRSVPLDPSKGDAEEVARLLRRMMEGGDGEVEVITVEELLKRYEPGRKPAPGAAAPAGSQGDARGIAPASGFDAPATMRGPGWPPALPAKLAFIAQAFAAVQTAPPLTDRATAAAGAADVAATDGAADGGVTVAVDKDSNSLLLLGSPREIERAMKLIEQASKTLPTEASRVRSIKLPASAEPGKIASIVTGAVARITPAGGQPGDLAKRVAIVADEETRSLLVVASDRDFEAVGQLVAALARGQQSQQVVVKSFVLRNTGAERVAEAMRSILTQGGSARLRSLAVTLAEDGSGAAAGDGTAATAEAFDPTTVRVFAERGANAVTVVGSPEAVAFADRFVTFADRADRAIVPELRLVPVKHAKAADVVKSLQTAFLARSRSLTAQGIVVGVPEFTADERTNTVVIAGGADMGAEIERLLAVLDAPSPIAGATLETIAIMNGRASDALATIEKVVFAADPSMRDRAQVVADDAAGVLLVRADAGAREQIGRVIAEVDRSAARQFAIRQVKLERADAQRVATALQKLFDDRASMASGGRTRAAQRSVSIVADVRSASLFVTASDADFAEISELIKGFDAPETAKSLDFKVFALKHARASEIAASLEQLLASMGSGGADDMVSVRADERRNSIIVAGRGDRFGFASEFIDAVDVEPAAGDARSVRTYELKAGDVDQIAGLVRDAIGERQLRPWETAATGSGSRVIPVTRSRKLVVRATEAQHREIKTLLDSLAKTLVQDGRQSAVVPVQFATPAELATTLKQFLDERSAAGAGGVSAATIVASASGGALLVAGTPDELSTIRDLVARLDQPQSGGDRRSEIIVLRKGQASEIARLVGEQFRGRSGGQGVSISPDVRTNSIIVSAPPVALEQVKSLVERLDAPASADETVIRTFALTNARAEEAVRILTSSLQLDAKGRTQGVAVRLDPGRPAVQVNARIIADPRSNSLVVTATPESFPVIDKLLSQLEESPAKSAIEYRIIPLQFAAADDVARTLGNLASGSLAAARAAAPGTEPPRIEADPTENRLIVAATAEQFRTIQDVVKAIDVRSEKRRITEFVPLKNGKARGIQEALSYFYGAGALDADTASKQAVRIIGDEATNSLVISAEQSEWKGIRELLERLDTEQYDGSRQLRVVPLKHADARSVARAINEAFEDTRPKPPAPQPAQQGQQQQLLVQQIKPEEYVSASADEVSNNLVIAASPANMRKIDAIIAQLDLPDFAQLPAPRLIAVRNGNPEQLARSIERVYGNDRATGRNNGLRIVGDATSNALIVRASEEDFARIAAIAEALQEQASEQGLQVHLLPLKSAPAPRVASAIREAFTQRARQAGLTLSIQIDTVANSLVIASTGPLFEEIRRLVEQMDAMAPDATKGIFIIDLVNTPPENAKKIIEEIGLDRAQSADSVAKVISEPLKVSVAASRSALVIVANPADRDTILSLVKSIDADPPMADSDVRVVRMKNAAAPSIAATLRAMVDQAAAGAGGGAGNAGAGAGAAPRGNGLARALQEQVRRLRITPDGSSEPIALDLQKPVKILSDAQSNTLILASTTDNVRALEEAARLFDTLPVTDAAVVRILPLENIQAQQFQRIVRELFAQGKQLGGLTGTQVKAQAGGTTGEALAQEIAISVDDRTNTVVVAGKEEAVAFVEVMKEKLDSAAAVGWIEPRIVKLQYADARDLAETLRAVLVEGSTKLPESGPLQKQVGRIRMARAPRGDQPARAIESDVFVPFTQLVIRPDLPTNSLVLVGSTQNLEIVEELVAQLDTEAAAPGSIVRVYPLENASASRIGPMLVTLFDQQVAAKAIRAEDRVRVVPDDRLNSLVVSTSARSFSIVEEILRNLDRKVAPEYREIRTMDLRNASAPRIAAILQKLMDARVERLQKTQPQTADLERAIITADERTNQLLVAAGADSFDVIKSLLEDLDSERLLEESSVEVIPVKKANIDRLVGAITQILNRRYAELSPEVAKRVKPLVIADPRTSSLLVAGGPEDGALVKEIVAKLDEIPANSAIGVHVLPLAAARAETIAPRIQQLMRDRANSLGTSETPSDAVSIVPDVASNSLVVAASEENFEVVKGLVDLLAKAAESQLAEKPFEVIVLAKTAAADMARMLDEMYVAEENRRRGATIVQAKPDARLNAIVASGPEADIAAIRRLIAQLDGAKPQTVVEIKYIALKGANVQETVGLIQSVLSGASLAGRAGQQATVLKYLRQLDGQPSGEGAEMEISAATRQSISLTPDVRTNTIIVRAPRESMALIEQMVHDLDGSTSGSQNIRIFKMANADASQMARILKELFSLRQQGSLYVLKPREAGDQPAAEAGASGEALAAGAAQAGTLGSDLTLVPDDRQQLSITVDDRTNSLLVSGTPNYLELVEKVVKELDQQQANERDTFAYKLKNATATEVARVVNEFVSEDQRKILQTLSADELPSASKLLEREVTVVGDSKSNTVLVNASPRYMEKVQDIIKELDVDPPQVLIQVLLAEVSLDRTESLGAEFGRATIGEFGVAAGMGNIGTVGGRTDSQLLGSLFTNSGTPNVAIGAEDFELLINALASQSRVQVLSNPSVMVENNSEGFIQVGETIRLPSGVSFSSAGQQSSVTPEDIGIILTVKPSINPEGFVRMQIEPEISRLSLQTTQISENFNSPVVTRRRATTTVTVKDGQTVVIGGLISDRFERVDRKIPLLGDIPLVGALFRQYKENSSKTELLIVLTPHVVRSPTEGGGTRAADLTEDGVQRLSLPPSLLEQIRKGQLEGKGQFEDGAPREEQPASADRAEVKKLEVKQADGKKPS